MSAERDKLILVGVGGLVVGFAAGVASLIWLLNRNSDIEKKPEVVEKTAEIVELKKAS